MNTPEQFFTPQHELLLVRYDVNQLLQQHVGNDWQQKYLGSVARNGGLVVRDAQHHTCREADPTDTFGLHAVEGDVLAIDVPGMWELYRGAFFKLMQAALPPHVEGMRAYDSPEHALECVTQFPQHPEERFARRMEAHVDQRRTAILVIKEPPEGEGELIVGHNKAAKNVEEIDADCTRLAHLAGTLVCFCTGDIFPHYTKILTTPGSQRTVVSLNYPKLSETPEAAQELLQHNYNKGI